MGGCWRWQKKPPPFARLEYTYNLGPHCRCPKVTVSPELFSCCATWIGRLDVASRLLGSSEMHVSSERLNTHI